MHDLVHQASYMAHGYCLLWKPWLVTLHAGSDFLIFAAYSAIPIAIWLFLRKRRDLVAELKPLAVLFAAFIFLCGLSHLTEVATLWWPVYETQGWVKVATALVSLATAAVIFPLIPKALEIPSPQKMQMVNAGLEREASAHRETLEALEASRRELERRVAERTEELSASRARFQALVQASAQVVWTTSADGQVVEDLPSWRAFSGQTSEELRGLGWLGAIHPDDKERTRAAWLKAIATKQMYSVEYRLRHVSGEWRWTDAKGVPLLSDTGEVIEWVGMNTDITERKKAEATLERINEELEARVRQRTDELEEEANRRFEAEAQLRQSQKMESVGQLAGGIAHDFNNALHVIIGSLDRIQRKLRDANLDKTVCDAIERPIGLASRAAQNAAQLTHRLLAFSRRQTLKPSVIDVTELVRGLSNLITRTLGETVELKIAATQDIWPVLADTNQLENVLVNLAVNARDAMPQGGQLVIETSNIKLDGKTAGIPAGEYVLVAVADTGSGMPKEVMERAFEPFFTTKEVGRGTGLGLAMVYGFMKQSGGHIRLDSKQGHGTSVKLYFPKASHGVLRQHDEQVLEPQHTPRARAGEAILAVEDDEEVRAYVSAALEELGYSVVAATDAANAIGLLKEHEAGHFALLFTDVVLPGGVNGRELAAQAIELCPQLKVLFTTGFASDAIVHQGRIEPDVDLITKPFNPDQLARKVREVLDRGRSIAEERS